MVAHYALGVISDDIGDILNCIISKLAFSGRCCFVKKVRREDFDEFVTLYILPCWIDLCRLILWCIMELYV
jgi:hypothetical protein